MVSAESSKICLLCHTVCRPHTHAVGPCSTISFTQEQHGGDSNAKWCAYNIYQSDNTQWMPPPLSYVFTYYTMGEPRGDSPDQLVFIFKKWHRSALVTYLIQIECPLFAGSCISGRRRISYSWSKRRAAEFTFRHKMSPQTRTIPPRSVLLCWTQRTKRVFSTLTRRRRSFSLP